MRLTIINQFYAPDLPPTAQLAASLADHRAELGDEVSVVASRGGYVAGSVRQCSTGLGNPKVYRIWTPRLGKATIVRRCLDYAVFYVLAARQMLSLPPQDVIVSLTTPPYIAWTAVLHKLLNRRTRVILWNMDCYPEIAERSGAIKPGGFLSRIMRAMNRLLFRHIDQLVCLDAAMASLLQSNYSSQDGHPPTAVIPNWEKASLAAPHSNALHNHNKEKFVVLYTGNMGHGHTFETVLDAAGAMRDEPVTFLFNGGGAQANVIKEAAQRRNLANIVVQGYGTKENVLRLMAGADCALITLRDEALGVMSPSKMHGNLAMGLPLIYIGPKGSNVDEAIGRFGCGVSLRHGNAAGLVDSIRTLMTQQHRLSELRHRAREAFEAAYNNRRTLPLFDAVIEGRTADIDERPVGKRAA